MANVLIRKRGTTFQYPFEIALQDGKRKLVTKSGFKTKYEAERTGIKALNEYLETGYAYKTKESKIGNFKMEK